MWAAKPWEWYSYPLSPPAWHWHNARWHLDPLRGRPSRLAIILAWLLPVALAAASTSARLVPHATATLGTRQDRSWWRAVISRRVLAIGAACGGSVWLTLLAALAVVPHGAVSKPQR